MPAFGNRKGYQNAIPGQATILILRIKLEKRHGKPVPIALWRYEDDRSPRYRESRVRMTATGKLYINCGGSQRIIDKYVGG